MAFFNPIRPSYVENPYPALARLRTEAPVYYSQELGAWIVTRYEDCALALRDEQTFGCDFSSIHSAWWDATRARQQALLGDAEPLTKTDPPDHNRMREVVAAAFTPRAVQALRAHIESVVARLLDGFPSGVPFDLMEDFARPLPRAVIAEQLGVGAQDREAFSESTQAVMRGIFSMGTPADAQIADEARRSLLDYLARIDAQASGSGGSGVLAQMLDARRAARLSEDELLSLAIDVAIAGNDATANFIGNWAVAVLQRPGQLAALRADPSLIADAIDEFIRYDSPVQAVPRVVTNDVVIGRTRLAKGSLVYLMIGAANRDPAQFPRPDDLDTHREERRHLGFGAGLHYCLGAPLARLEIEVALTALLARFPALRLAPNGVERDAAFDKRGPTRLMVVAE